MPADHTPNRGGPAPAVNPLPPVVIALFLFIMGIEVLFWLGNEGLVGGPAAIGWRWSAIQTYAFSGDVWDWMVDNNQWPREQLLRFVAYPFVHSSFTHALFVGVILLAMGKMVGEAFGGPATLAIFVLSGVFGALAYGAVLDSSAPLLGGFPNVYGLIGGFTFLLWRKLGQVGAQQIRAFYLIAFLMGLQLVFGALSGLLTGATVDLQAHWVADLAGFGAGFVLSFFLAPGGLARILAALRRD